VVEVLEGFHSFGFEVGEDGVSAATGFAEVTSLEGDPDSPFGVVRLVDGVVDPPGAVIIPEVMIWVFRIDFDAECGQWGQQ